MARGANAQLAVVEFHALLGQHGYGPPDVWKAIAELLLTCQIQLREGWAPFHDVVVYRESNDFELNKLGEPNATIRKAEQLSSYLASQLGCPRQALCARIGAYWRHAKVSGLQQHNLVGHAFRSMVVEALKKFGAPGVAYEEEVLATTLFKNWPLKSRSKKPKIDIVAFKGVLPVALLSTRWRYRHDRVDFIDEAHSYDAAGARMYGGLPFIAVTGEFSPSRIGKVLDNAPPVSKGPVSAVVHFNPKLVTDGLGENGRMSHLMSLDWLIAQSSQW